MKAEQIEAVAVVVTRRSPRDARVRLRVHRNVAKQDMCAANGFNCDMAIGLGVPPLPHSADNVAGGKGGLHIRYQNPVPLANVHLTLLERVGVHLDKFADSTQRLEELL